MAVLVEVEEQCGYTLKSGRPGPMSECRGQQAGARNRHCVRYRHSPIGLGRGPEQVGRVERSIPLVAGDPTGWMSRAKQRSNSDLSPREPAPE